MYYISPKNIKKSRLKRYYNMDVNFKNNWYFQNLKMIYK